MSHNKPDHFTDVLYDQFKSDKFMRDLHMVDSHYEKNQVKM